MGYPYTPGNLPSTSGQYLKTDYFGTEGVPAAKLLELDFTVRPSQAMPQTAAEMVTLLGGGGAPAPYAIYGFQETSGVIADLIGSDNLTVTGALHGKPCADLNIASGTQKALEFHSATADKAEAAASTVHDFDGTGQSASFAILTINRVNYRSTIATGEAYAHISAGFLGYELYGQNVNFLPTAYLYTPGTTKSIGVTPYVGGAQLTAGWGQWTYSLLYVHRTDNKMGLFVPGGAGELDITGLATVGGGAGKYTLGKTIDNGVRQQVAYQAFWVGSAAEALKDGWSATYEDLAWTHSRRHGDVIDAQQVMGSYRQTFISATKVGAASSGDIPQEYGLVSGGTGASCSENVVHGLALSEEYDSASWTKSNITVSAAEADLDLSPRDFTEAVKLTADANDGYIKQAFTGVNATSYGVGVFVKKHTDEASDTVAGHLALWDESGTPAEIGAGQDFTATDTWQWVPLVVTSTDISMSFRVSIDTSGDILCCALATVHEGTRALPRFQGGASVIKAFSAIRLNAAAAGLYCKGEKGEIEATAISHDDNAPLEAMLVSVYRAADAKDKRDFTIGTDEKVNLKVTDDAGSLDHTTTSTNVVDIDAEQVYVSSWNSLSNSKVVADSTATQTADTWDASDLTTTVSVGIAEGDVAVFNGIISKVTIYDKPR